MGTYKARANREILPDVRLTSELITQNFKLKERVPVHPEGEVIKHSLNAKAYTADVSDLQFNI